MVLGAGALFRKEITVETYFDESVQGLDVGSPVKYRGVTIGKVAVIDTVSGTYEVNSRYILVRSTLYPKYLGVGSKDEVLASLKKEINNGLRIRLTPQGLTGSAYLEADYLKPDQYPYLLVTWLPSYPYVPSAPSRITQLAESLTRIMTNIEDINVQNLMKQLESTLGTLTSAIQQIDFKTLNLEATKLITEVRQTNRHIADLIGGMKEQGFWADVEASTSAARRIVETAEKPLEDGMASFNRTARNLERLSSGLQAATTTLPRILTRLETTLRRLDHLASLPRQDLEETLENIRRISDNLKELTENSKKYPSQILFGSPPTPVSPGRN